MRNARLLAHADRHLLYLLDFESNELYVLDTNMPQMKGMRIPCDEGIAGAAIREVQNITDVASDARYDDTFDREWGYRTHSILALPLRSSPDTSAFGVMEFINKRKPGDQERPTHHVSNWSKVRGMTMFPRKDSTKHEEESTKHPVFEQEDVTKMTNFALLLGNYMWNQQQAAEHIANTGTREDSPSEASSASEESPPVARQFTETVEEVARQTTETVEATARQSTETVDATARQSTEIVEATARQSTETVAATARQTTEIVEEAARQSTEIVEGDAKDTLASEERTSPDGTGILIDGPALKGLRDNVRLVSWDLRDDDERVAALKRRCEDIPTQGGFKAKVENDDTSEGLCEGAKELTLAEETLGVSVGEDEVSVADETPSGVSSAGEGEAMAADETPGGGVSVGETKEAKDTVGGGVSAGEGEAMPAEEIPGGVNAGEGEAMPAEETPGGVSAGEGEAMPPDETPGGVSVGEGEAMPAEETPHGVSAEETSAKGGVQKHARCAGGNMESANMAGDEPLGGMEQPTPEASQENASEVPEAKEATRENVVKGAEQANHLE